MPGAPEGTFVKYSNSRDHVRFGDEGSLGISTDDVTNDSGVAGATCSDALDALDAAIGNLGTDDISNDSGVAGASCSDALDQLDTDIGNLGTDDISNDSGVAGASCSDALNTLDAAIGNLGTDDISNDSAVAGASCSDALNTLDAAIPVPGFADMYENSPGAPSNIVCAVQNTFYPWISAALGELDGTLITFNNDDVNGDYLEIKPGGAGKYKIDLSGSFSGTASSDWEIYLFLGALQQRIGARRALNAASDVGSFAGVGILDLAQGSLLRVKVRCTSAAAATYGVEVMNLSLNRLE